MESVVHIFTVAELEDICTVLTSTKCGSTFYLTASMIVVFCVSGKLMFIIGFPMSVSKDLFFSFDNITCSEGGLEMEVVDL